MPLNWLNMGVGAIAAFALSWLLHTVDVGYLEKRQKTALIEQEKVLTGQCAKDKEITKEANDALQKNISDITGKLNTLKRLHKASCVPVPAGNPNIAASGGEYARSYGISSDWLREYAAECETYRQERITLEKFVNDVWQK